MGRGCQARTQGAKRAPHVSDRGRRLAPSDLAKYADDAAQNPGLGGEDRLHLVVLGLQADVVRLAVKLLPLVMRDALRRQRRYKRLIESGKWP